MDRQMLNYIDAQMIILGILCLIATVFPLTCDIDAYSILF